MSLFENGLFFKKHCHVFTNTVLIKDIHSVVIILFVLMEDSEVMALSATSFPVVLLSILYLTSWCRLYLKQVFKHN